jgi:acetyl esterase/lipase
VTAIPATEGPSAGQVGPPPPFDAELRPALDVMAARGRPEFSLAAIPLIRQAPPPFPVPTDDDLRRGGAFEVSTAAAPGPAGAPDVPLLICRPAGVAAPVACLYYIHGGGMITGDYRSGLPRPLDHAAELNLAVVSVDYRLAPETPHPGPVEDCYAGLAWTAAHAAELGIDPARLVVGGTSAGGGLAAAVALLARDRGGPALAGQLLICPMLDDRNDTPSSWQMAGLGVWDRGQRGRLDGAARRRARRPRRLAVRRARQGDRPVRPAARVHRRGLRGDLPRRGRGLRRQDLAGGRLGRTARVAGRLPRLRRPDARRVPVPRRRGGPAQLAAPPAVLRLTLPTGRLAFPRGPRPAPPRGATGLPGTVGRH